MKNPIHGQALIGVVAESLAFAPSILAHWERISGVHVRSDKVRGKYLRRIEMLLSEGCEADKLKLAASNACKDKFYVERGYHKNPEVIWRNAGRVEQLAAWRPSANGKGGFLDVMAEGLKLGNCDE